MINRPLSRSFEYSIALLLIPFAILASFLYQSIFGYFAAAFFYLGVFLSTWFGGKYPGLLTTVLSLLAIDYFFIPPLYSFWNVTIVDYSQLIVFAIIMVVIVWTTSELIYARRRIEKISQKLIKQSELRLSQALHAANMGVWEYGLETGKMIWSPEHERLFGLAPKSFDGRYETFESYVHPDDRQNVKQFIQSANDRQEDLTLLFRIIWADRSIHWLEYRGQIASDDKESPLRLIGTVMNVDDRIRAEQAIQNLNRELEAKVEKQTARLKLALSAAAIGFWDWNLTENTIVCDERMQKLYGIATDLDTSDPENWISCIHPEDRPATIAALQQTQLGEKDFDCEFRVVHPDGAIRFIRAFGQIQYDEECKEECKPQNMVGINYDLTDIKHNEESLKNYALEIEDLYNNAPCGYHMLDLDDRYIQANNTELSLLGYSREELIGKPATLFLTDASTLDFLKNLPALKQQGSIKDLELEMVCKDGSVLSVLLNASAVYDDRGNYLKTRCTLLDNRDRKHAVEMLQLSNERISLANAELSRATRLKDEFLTSMSHELRTPLNAILGMSEALSEEINGSLNSKQQKSVALIQSSGNHLLILINDILDLAKIEAGKMELEIAPFKVRQLCNSSLSFVKEKAYKKQISLQCNIDSSIDNIELDERRIRQVLINLLSNAVKFTPEGGRVELSVLSKKEQQIVQFIVSDTGIGISSDQIDMLFKPFVQIDSSLSRSHDGTGLGLVIVRRIVELHGGSVILESEVGRGSRFTANLPLRESELSCEGSISSPAIATQNNSIKRVLIVEDSESAANQLVRYLTEIGMTSTIHPLGRGVVDLALKFKPDAIVLDILLPDQNGWEALIELKNNSITKSIPVLIVSVINERAKGLTLGAEDYLLKPYTRTQLLQSLNRIENLIAEKQQTEPVFATDSRKTSPLIVLAEDNEANIATTLNYLETYGLQMMVARNGLEAVQLVKQYQPNIVLMDIQMPEMDGLTAIIAIRAEPNLANIPIIALTALAMPGDRERCLTAGANEYLTKPVRFQQLMQTIKQHLPDWSG